MKTIKFLKINLVAIVAIVFASTVMSFNTHEKKIDGNYHYYNSAAVSSFNTLSKWNVMNNSENCIAGGERPCKVFVPEGQTLTDVIGGKTDQYILQEAEGTKD